MSRLARFVNTIFSAIFGVPVTASKSIFSTILDWTAAMYAEFTLIVMRRVEQDFAPLLKPTMEKAEKTGKVPPELQPLIDEIKNPTHEIGSILSAAAGNQATGSIIGSTLGPLLMLMQYEGQRLAIQARFDPKTALALKFRRPDKLSLLQSDLKDQGWSEERSELLEDAASTRLMEDKLLALYMRGQIDIDEYVKRMHDIGYKAEEAWNYATASLAYPGVGDLVRMAVKEAFTPEIAERFGQYQDLPPEFLDKAKQIGLSDEWAKAFWAAHWDLPGAQMGFDMLHRGIINNADLQLLLKALDIMPYWRDKLVQLAYNPLTRVDVRRMYNLDILTVDQVKQSYKILGYDEANAQHMTDFTVQLRQATGTQTEKELTKTDILTAYRSGLYSREETVQALVWMSYSQDDAELIVDAVKISSDIAVKDLTLSQVKTLYQAKLRTKAECTAWLTLMSYDAAAIKAFFDLWDWTQPVDPHRPTRTDLDNFISAGIIDLTAWSEEYTALGYDMKYQEWYYAYLIERGKVTGQ